MPWCIVVLGMLLGSCSDRDPYMTSRFSVGGDHKSKVRQRVFLIGDAGDPQPAEPVLEALQARVKIATEKGEKSAIVFLGDNAYPHGLPAEEGKEHDIAKDRLDQQIRVVTRSGAKGYFIPGNHDGERYGLQPQERYVNARLKRIGGFLPKSGRIVSKPVDLDGVRLVMLDTNEWLKLAAESKSQAKPVSELKSLIGSAGRREVMVLGHHPLQTHGVHGGFYDWSYHLFPQKDGPLKRIPLPLPIVGSLFPLFVNNAHFDKGLRLGPRKEDLHSRAYQSMVKSIDEALAAKRPLIYAAGHDHNLQVLEGQKHGAQYILVSGLGSTGNETTVTHRGDTLFSHLHPGFMSVEFMRDSSVWLEVIEPGKRPFRTILKKH